MGLSCLLLTACGEGSDDDGAQAGPVTIDVVRQGWTGWSREQPKPITRQVTVSEGESFRVDDLGGEIVFTVKHIDDGRVELESSESLSPREGDAGVDLRSDQDEFELTADGPLTVTTPTMDAGVTFTLTLV